MPALHLHDLLEASAAQPAGAVLDWPSHRPHLAYGDLGRVVRARARLLRGAGLRPGDRVCLLGHGSAAYLGWLLGASAAQCVFVPLNVRWSAAETEAAVADSGAAAFVAAHAFDRTAAAAVRRHPHVRRYAMEHPSDEGNGGNNDDADLPPPPRRPAHPCCLVYTSGTTGTPKGAALSHRAHLAQALEKVARLKLDRRSVYVSALGLSTVGGLSSLLAAVAARATVVFVAGKFEAGRALAACAACAATHVTAVPAMVVALHAAARGTPRPSVRSLLLGAQAVTAADAAAAHALFPRARVLTSYACTEACSSMTFARLPARAGEAPRHVELAVCDPRTGARRRAGAVGAVRTRGPHVMDGYWDGGTQKVGGAAGGGALLPGGWLATGDLGALDSRGRLTVVGRAKDIIKTGGETVVPSEVAAALATHPAVAEACVFGAPDARLGETVAAALVLAPGAVARPADQALRDHVARCGLARFKLPRRVHWLPGLGREVDGKVSVLRVRAMVEAAGRVPRSRL